MTISLMGKSVPQYASGYVTEIPGADGTSEKMFVMGATPSGITLDAEGVRKLVDYLDGHFPAPEPVALPDDAPADPAAVAPEPVVGTPVSDAPSPAPEPAPATDAPPAPSV